MRKAIASIIALVVGGSLMIMTPGRINAWTWVRNHGGCVSVPHESPYGNVQSCRFLDDAVPWFSGVDANVFLLLETDRGLVVIRVDYRDIDMGRQYTAKATELASDQASDELSAEELPHLTAAVAARGGIRNEEWTIIYGDG